MRNVWEFCNPDRMFRLNRGTLIFHELEALGGCRSGWSEGLKLKHLARGEDLWFTTGTRFGEPRPRPCKICLPGDSATEPVAAVHSGETDVSP
jgi:hypothetical protein